MKKFFGLIVLLAVVLFSSCSFNNTRKKGSVDFSIPIGEIIALRNEIAEEEVIEEEYDENQEEIEYESEYKELYSFLVQIKGDKGYHEIRYEYLDDTDMEELDNAKFHFSFDNLPANQIYKVMIDVYAEQKRMGHDEESSHALLIYSGDKDNIVVFPGETTREELVLEEANAYSYSNFNIVVTCKDGTTETTETIELDVPDEIPAVFTRCEQRDNDAITYKYYVKIFTEKNPKTEKDEYCMIWGYEDQDPDSWKEITDLSFQLREDSHFWGFDFEQPVTKYNKETGKEEMETVTLEFDDDGICSVYEYLSGESQLFNYPLSAQLKMDNSTISSSMWAPMIIIPSITFKEKEPDVDPKEGKTLKLSIPGVELKGGDSSAGDGSSDIMYTYLVQVRSFSNSNYYAAETKTVNAQTLKETQVFTFTGLDYGTNYNAMVDIFSNSERPLLTYAGDEKFEISGDTTSLEVAASPTSIYSYSDFFLFLTYTEGDSTYPHTESLEESPEDFSAMFAKCKVETTNGEEYKYYFRQKKSADEEIPSLGFEDENPNDWTEITDFYFGLKEDSHYRKFSFVQPVSKGDEISTIDLIFDDDNLCEVTEYLEGNSYIFNLPLSATLTFDDGATFEASLLTPQVRFADITFAEKEKPKAETFTDTQSGEITIQESKLSFEPWNVQEGQEKVRYMTTVPLSTILDGKHLSDGDTIVFILTVDGIIEKGSEQQDIFDQLVVNKQFYYQLQEDNWETKYADDDEGLFKNNNCINYDSRTKGDYTFVMPLNQIEDPEDYCNLQLFFDCPKGTDDEKFEFNCSINYTIFPTAQKAFVFGVGKNWDKNPNTNPDAPDYRYELNNVLRDINGNPLELTGGDTVQVILQGKIRAYSNSGFENLSPDTTFNAELYDNAYYEGSSFHALSIDNLEGNVTNTANVKQLSMGTDGGLASYGAFIFSPIAEPYSPKTTSETEPSNFKNDFRFQCHTPCDNPAVLLVVTDYYFGNQVTHKTGN